MLFTKKSISLTAIVCVIRIYGAFIEAKLPGGIYLMDIMKEELALLNIPVIAMIILLPLICGLTTGIAVGYVGASFPIVINLIGASPSPGLLLSTAILAYGAGYIGLLFSPVHVCNLVTNQHFKTNLGKTLTGLIFPGIVFFICCILVSMVTRVFYGASIWGM